MFRLARSALNIGLLFSALVAAPLFALAHFNAPLAAMLADFSGRYLPNTTLLSSTQRSAARTERALHKQRTQWAARGAANRKAGKLAQGTVKAGGKRILVRGAGALMVGWVPVLGVSADVISLGEDYRDLCGVFASMDELLALLHADDTSLYEENYCHLPDQGIAILKETAAHSTFGWEQTGDEGN